ncbi:CDP-diacylglycerol--serine O-phosphatidyltransferase [bacterium]|nr:CDP-diacylglycerol--serine O-phosphatidyltransferase [bacterium]
MKRDRHAYILILPSLFTTANLFCGYYSILRSIHGDFAFAGLLIMAAGICDTLDGRVARMTKTQTRFGMEYDSIADVVSFGMAPALLGYLWGLKDYGRAGVAVCFLYAACGALRLARFNTLAASADQPRSYFVGLPSPAAAISISSLAIAGADLGWTQPEWVLFPCLVGLGLLMVSNIRYRSFKDFDVRHRRRFFLLVFLIVGLAFVILKPEVAVLAILFYYVLWGPVREVSGYFNRRLERRNQSALERE